MDFQILYDNVHLTHFNLLHSYELTISPVRLVSNKN
nr:MAG TPA: hypothetical protein [Caudoviricetes sp.]